MRHPFKISKVLILDAAPPARYSAEYQSLRAECWQQLLRLFSGKDFFFKSEHWPAFVELVSWHHILIDVLPELSGTRDFHSFNQQQLAQLDTHNLNLRRKALVLAEVQNQLCEQLTQSGIRHLFFKGIALSQSLYKSSTARQCRDIDLIVHPQDHALTSSQLEQMGCVRKIPRHNLSQSGYKRYCAAMKDVSYQHQKTGAIIELHWALRPFPQAFTFDFDSAYESRRILELDQISLPVFSDLLHARYLAAHGCLSHWGRLRWLLDWKKICDSSHMDWELLVNSCASTREAGYLKKAFLLSNAQFDVDIPEPIKAIKALKGSEFWLTKLQQAQQEARYPSWLTKQRLNLANQQDFKGVLGYSQHMIKKLLAAYTLKP